MRKKYQIVIVGAGSSAIFVSFIMTQAHSKDIKIFERKKEKFYTNRVKVSSSLETDVENLFLIGDGEGITRGLMQASISGMMAANEIVKRMGFSQKSRLFS